MGADDRHVCEPVTYDEPVGARWTCPDCAIEYESRPGQELDGWLRRLPGVDVSRTFWRPVQAETLVMDDQWAWMMSDEPDEAPGLAEVAAQPRRFRRADHELDWLVADAAEHGLYEATAEPKDTR